MFWIDQTQEYVPSMPVMCSFEWCSPAQSLRHSLEDGARSAESEEWVAVKPAASAAGDGRNMIIVFGSFLRSF